MSGVAGVAGLPAWLNIYGLHAWGDGFMMVVVTLVCCPRRCARVVGGCVAARLCNEDSTLRLLFDATQIDLGGGGWVAMMVCVVDK